MHSIYMKDGVASMAYNNKNGMPWHKLGTPVEGLMSTAEAIRLGKLDWTVEKSPLFTRFQDTVSKDHFSPEVPDIFAVRRTDNNQILGTVGSGYEIIQNTEAFNFFDEISDKAMIETVGCLGNGGTIFIMAKLPEGIMVGKDDMLNCYLLLTTAHDGTCSIICKFTPVRVVCQNTLTMALQGMQKEVRIKHTKTASTRLSNAHKLLGIACEQHLRLTEIYNSMANKVLTPEVIKNYLDSLFPLNVEKDEKGNIKPQTRRENIRAKVVELTRSGMGNNGNTVWDLYNGTTEYVDHHRVVKNDGNRWEASTFGSGVDLKEKAFDAACALL